jgi:GDP-D-mannose dehydratase
VHKQIVDKKQIRTNEILDVVADIKKTKTELSWEPKTNFNEGIKKLLK